MRRFSIFHPIEGKVNEKCLLNYTYEFVITFEAQNLVRSLYLGQDKFNPDYQATGRRNTTTGDLITVDEKLYMVRSDGGFKRVPSTKPLYKEVMEIDEAIIEILSRKKLTDDDVNDLIENCY